ncbi:hypothetical protein JYG23_11855 [Sedimentibacter sp. zth1]|uniref:hypothetical protein n=1 Tax=Sedimentibacter sp. zth1 TaxID=2816908 RepID=UPI001A913F0C|nr:hypothetical protein [Sedimentibacter sp. zth1]QSX05364.1 hypothetical protein JYG23_11855 [Sedimentibacter sp. zth1]
MANRMKQTRWRKLDNAAKIFPPTATNRDTKVFRCSCELYEDIDEETLQCSVNQTIEKFPLYKSVMKKGLFWYYLEETLINPVVKQEYKMVCAPLYNSIKKNLLFEVTYYNKRINLEVYHALSDGAGAIQFFQTLIYYYLTNIHGDELKSKNILMNYDASEFQKMDDSFFKYYKKTKVPSKQKKEKAFHLKEEKLEVGTLSVIEGKASVKHLLSLAHQYNVTITTFLTANLIEAFAKKMPKREYNKPIVVSVPVNLRTFFESNSARNFFCVTSISYNVEEWGLEFNTIIKKVEEQIKSEITVEKLNQRMIRLGALENKIATKIIPLVLKNPIMKIAYKVTEKYVTTSLSNVGKIKMPDEFKPYINMFDVFTSANKTQIVMCSYNDNCVISFTSPYINTDVQRSFFRKLTSLGVDVEVTSNLGTED